MFKKVLSLIIVICCIWGMPIAGFAKSSQINVGDTVVFGSYEQDLNKGNGKEDLEWIVLDIDDGEALLITKLCLDKIAYNDKDVDVTWETCSLREWLNEDFYDNAFTKSEQNEIIYTNLQTPDNSAFGTDGGRNTTDKVFILSEQEADDYFDSDSDRIAGHMSLSNVKTNENMSWWLRTPGMEQKYASQVYGTSGKIGSMGSHVTNKVLCTVRPCIKLELSVLTGSSSNGGTSNSTVSSKTNALVNPGDSIYLGIYEQDGNSSNGMEPIEWRVLTVENNAAYVVSEYCLDSKPYNEKNKDITWEKCTLRRWLNDDFYNLAFSDDEKQCILEANVVNEQPSYFNTDGGNNTKDYIFLLNQDEALMFLGNNSQILKDDGLRASATKYAENNGALQIDGYCFWWLRSIGISDQNTATNINVDGCIVNSGYEVSSSYSAVRPSMWIDLNRLYNNSGNNSSPSSTVTSSPIIQDSEDDYETITTELSQKDRDWHHYYKGTRLNYNVFTPGEVKDCYGVSMSYSCKIKDNAYQKNVTGTRSIYVRDKASEEADDDNAWIYVGQFEYDKMNGQAVTVNVNWEDDVGPVDVYSMVIVIEKDMSGTTYTSSWGDVVTLYSYDY